MRPERIVITGGSGFVGLNIAEVLLSSGIDVVSFDRAPVPAAALKAFSQLPGRFDVVEGDIRDVQQLLMIARNTDAIVHGVAITPNDANEAAAADLALSVNVGGTINAVHAATVTRLRRMIFLGSAAVYGANAISGEPLDERRTEPSPSSIYAVSKYAAERMAERIAFHEHVSLRLLRLGSVFGPWEYSTDVRATLSAIFQSTAISASGAGVCVLPRPGRRDWIYSRDVARAIMQILADETAVSGPVNIGLGHEWTVADWCARLSRQFPGFHHRLAAPGEMATVDFHGSGDRAPLAIERLRHDIGLEPEYGLDAAFTDYMSWIGSHQDFLEG